MRSKQAFELYDVCSSMDGVEKLKPLFKYLARLAPPSIMRMSSQVSSHCTVRETFPVQTDNGKTSVGVTATLIRFKKISITHWEGVLKNLIVMGP